MEKTINLHFVDLKMSLIVQFLTRIRRQWEDNSWCAGMVENTERTRQLKTKMNLTRTKEKQKSHKYDTHTHTIEQNDISGVTSETTTVTSRSNLKFQNIVSTGHKCAVDHRNVRLSGIVCCIFLCDKLLNPFWHWGRTRTRTTWQHNHRTYFLSAVNHEPDYYSISWDIKLIMLVCVTWFARNKQWNCGYWKTSNIRPFPHSDCHSFRQETVAFHLHNRNMLLFFLFWFVFSIAIAVWNMSHGFTVTVALDAERCEHICVLSAQISS